MKNSPIRIENFEALPISDQKNPERLMENFKAELNRKMYQAFGILPSDPKYLELGCKKLPRRKFKITEAENATRNPTS